jgi:hypothetical protein
MTLYAKRTVRRQLLAVPKSKLPAYLVNRLGKKYCSLCGEFFPKDAKPSLRAVFADHIRKAHQPPKKDKVA